MKNITLSADEHLIDAARERARAERTSLNEVFRRWLRTYAGGEERATEALRTIDELSLRLRTGGKHYTREQMNER